MVALGGIVMNEKNKLLLKLFFSTLYLSAFTFGGGYVIITLMRQKFVDEYHWIEESEMLDLVAIAQSSPGPIAVNGAIVLGYKLAGIKGIIVSVLGTIIPPFVIISIISMFYQLFKENVYVRLMLEGMQAGVGAVICSVVIDMASGLIKEKKWMDPFIMIIAFILNYIYHVNVVYIILGCIILGIIRAISKREVKS